MQDRDDQFESIIKEFGPAISRLAIACEFNTERRRDLIQEIYVAIWKSLSVFDGRASLRTWVYRVAHNTAATYVRTESRSWLSRAIDLVHAKQTPDVTDIHGELEARDLRSRLITIIHKLQSPDREVLLLYLEDFSASDIADVTGLSPASIATRIHRAKQSLAKISNQKGHNYDDE